MQAPTGLCTMLCARLFSPARIVAVDTDAYRLKLAREQGLADVTFMPGQDDAAAQIRAMTEGRGADVVFEVAGGRDTFQTAWQIARPNAVVVLVAMYEEPQILPLPEMYGKNLIFKTGGVDGCFCEENHGSDCPRKAGHRISDHPPVPDGSDPDSL